MVARACRLRNQVDGHHLARLGLAGVAGGTEDVVRDAPVLGCEHQHAMLVVQAADDAAVPALEHFHHLAHRAAAMVVPAGAHRGAVAMQSWRISAGGRKIELAALVGHQEAVPVRMALDAAGDHRDALATSSAPARFCTMSPARSSVLERAIEFAPLLARDTQARGELVGGERRARGLSRRRECGPGRELLRGRLDCAAAARFFWLFL